MLGGQIVDMQVTASINLMREGVEPPADLVERGRTTWARMLERSVSQADQMRAGKSLPMGAQPLHAHYYGLPVPPESVLRVEQRVERALFGFLSSPFTAKLRTIDSRRWMPQKQPWQPSAQEWSLDGILLWSNLDFWINYGERGFVVIDWKSGSRVGADEAQQLATYSLFGQVSRGLERERVLVQAVHLPEAPDWEVKPVSESECEVLRATIASEVSFERERTDQVELADGTNAFWAPREAFPPSPSISVCTICRFREICPEGQGACVLVGNT